MKPDFEARLRKVQNNLVLIGRLRKLALASEEALIERMGERTKKVLLDSRGKFVRALKQIEPSLDEKARSALLTVVEQLMGLVSSDGIVDHPAASNMKSGLETTWKTVSQATKGSTSVLNFFNAVEKFVQGALLGSLLQNPRTIERAKTDPKMRDRLYAIMEQMAQVLPQVSANLQKSIGSLPPPEAPPASPTSPADSIEDQLASVEKQMRGIADQLNDLLTAKAAELFGPDASLTKALDENIFAVFNKRKVNPLLITDKSFYQDALHLEHSPTRVELGDFLGNKNKKAIYAGYRSFIMALRALAVVQHARKTPEAAIQDPKLRSAVIKAQQILLKRKDAIVSYMNALDVSDSSKEEEVDPADRQKPRFNVKDITEPKVSGILGS